MGSFNFIISGTNKSFEVKGPQGMTYEQARAIFEKQVASGALVGFTTGDILSAATQTADGLAGAVAPLLQNAAGIKILSPEPVSRSQASVSRLPGAINIASSANVTAIAAATIGIKLNSTIILNPLTVGDYAKATPATSATVGNLSVTEITAAMAAVEKVSGQNAEDFTDNGVGKYAFSCEQLERAGYVKAGTADKFLSQNQNSLTSVLESSAVWTGKNNVKNVQGITSNSTLQTQIQQDLMTTGVQQARQLGIDISKMTLASASAMAVNSAKNVTEAVAWAKNVSLPAATESALSYLGRAAAFAINLVSFSLNDATKRITPEAPAVDTVNRATLDAASTRVVGNNKVPNVVPQAINPVKTTGTSLLATVNEFEITLISIRDKLTAYQISGTITQDSYDAIREEYATAKIEFNKRFDVIYQIAQKELATSANPTEAQKLINSAVAKMQTTILELDNNIVKLLAALLQTLALYTPTLL